MMAFIIWMCILVGSFIILHDLGMFGLFGRNVQNFLFAGRVDGPANREILLSLIEVEQNPDQYEIKKFQQYDSAGINEHFFMVIRDPRPNRYGDYEEHYILDVTGTPTTNPRYGFRYHRWSSSSRVLDSEVGGNSNLSVTTKDRIHELYNKDTETPDNPKKEVKFFKKMVHLS